MKLKNETLDILYNYNLKEQYIPIVIHLAIIYHSTQIFYKKEYFILFKYNWIYK